MAALTLVIVLARLIGCRFLRCHVRDVLIAILQDLKAVVIVGLKALEYHLGEHHACLQGLGVREGLGVQDDLNPLFLEVVS